MTFVFFCSMVFMFTVHGKIHSDENSVEHNFKDLGLDQIFKNHKEEVKNIMKDKFDSNTTLMMEIQSLYNSLIKFRTSVIQEVKMGMDSEMAKEMKIAISDLMASIDSLSMSNKELANIYDLNKQQIKQYNDIFEQCNKTISDLVVMVETPMN